MATKTIKKVAAKKSSKTVKPKVAEVSQEPVPSVPRVREFDEHGFAIGSDSSRIVAMLLEGGATRVDVSHKIAESLTEPTRYGKPKNVSSLVSGLLTRLIDKGYRIESTWKVVPPTASTADAAVKAASLPTPSATKAPAKRAATGRPAAKKTASTKPRKRA